MKRTQNNSLALMQEKPVGMTLQGDIDALIRSLQVREHTMYKKRRTRNDRVHWITRGRQLALRQVSARLFVIRAASLTTYTLYLALQEYLLCLDKYCIDAEEERRAVVPRNGFPIEQWKAEGETQELPRIVRVLSRIVQAYTPASIHHTLSLDGNSLVPLYDGGDEHFLECNVHAQSVSSQPLPVFDWLQLPTDSHTARELVLEGHESRQESASLPIHCGTSVPALGPFPILPNEVHGLHQALLLRLEDALSRHTRVLVNTEYEAVDTMHLLLMFLDRVLHYTSVERILVLAGSVQLLAYLRQCYRTWVSLEDGIPLSEHYAAQYKPTIPLAADTRICFSSIREMQLLTRSLHEQDTILCRQTYDLLIVYNLASLTAPWQHVLAYFNAFYWVGFGSSSDPLVANLFDDNVIPSEGSFQAGEGEDRFSNCRNELSSDGSVGLSS